LDLGHVWFLCRRSPQLIRQSMQDFPVGIDMRQRTLSYLYACCPLPSTIYQVSIKTSIYCLKCYISSKYKKRRRLVTATEVVVPSKDTEMNVPSKQRHLFRQKQPRQSFFQKQLRQSDILLACPLLLVLLQKLVCWIIKMLFTFLLHA
jgi:hypothetical protein